MSMTMKLSPADFDRMQRWLGMQQPDEEREDLFYGSLKVWTGDSEEPTVETEPWGTATDVAAAVLEAIEADDVSAFIIAMTRGVPEGVTINPRESDPRD